ncbi:3-deoxy-manno-octulosonate cytidylyltransferase [Sulfitobacter sp. NAS-14.1]|uniref:cytidylyltransferase domain-containing protein n=1 Tax=Sulfitobacter sp. (strain NAS-14.1) TaxID=314267 RepID=UPI000066BF03|nr:3-deoxy-manno-octulosonate cytidylyltransferase [Sulfitobacter sp. NAS-14.1]EAP78867.1 3-deoxy-manno-octulosonate cytidylyltransferase [Sulfitobacter sp. NAS-14.1]
MDARIAIPARYASIRYPGKPLGRLKGASGQPRTLMEPSISIARAESQGQIQIFDATNNERIAEEARRVGKDVIMASPKFRYGTERVTIAIAVGNISAEIVINLQGDAPLRPSHFVTPLVDVMRQDSECLVTTPCLHCDAETVQDLLDDRQAGRFGATTIFFDRDLRALYFSKEVLPFTCGKGIVNDVVPVFHHVGVYAYPATAPASCACLEPAHHRRTSKVLKSFVSSNTPSQFAWSRLRSQARCLGNSKTRRTLH